MVPASPDAMRRVASAALSARRRMRRASSKNTRPAGVSFTARLVRSSSLTPSTCSSSWICRDRGGWVMFMRAAALPKCKVSATATKQRIWCSSNCAEAPVMGASIARSDRLCLFDQGLEAAQLVGNQISQQKTDKTHQAADGGHAGLHDRDGIALVLVADGDIG